MRRLMRKRGISYADRRKNNMDSKNRAASVSNEVLNVIKECRSIRTYKADAIPEEILNAVVCWKI